MGHVTVTVNGRRHRMSCSDGQEERVAELAAYVESHVSEIKGGYKHVQEDRLFLMAALMVADELWDAREELRKVLGQMAALRSHQIIEDPGYSSTREARRIMDAAAARLEALDEHLSRRGAK